MLRENSRHTLEQFSIERVDNGIASLSRLHASKSNTSTHVGVVSQDPGGHDWAVRLKHALKVSLCHADRKIGQVQICYIPLLLLLQVHSDTTNKLKETI